MTSTPAPMLTLPDAAAVAYDMVAMGEVMLRLDPGTRRIRNTRTFDAWDSGAEYNVARAFRRAFGLRGALVSAFVRNEVGALLEDIILGSGLDLSFVHWVPFDGIGKSARNGLNFSERGFGVRGAIGCVDRANTAISQLTPDDVDWAELFRRGTRWFHTGGIMAGLSDQAAETTAFAMDAATEAGAVVSYDLNYRPSLWAAVGGVDRAREVNRDLVARADVLVGNEEDIERCLGITNDDIDPSLAGEIDVAGYEKLVLQVAEEFPRLKVIGVTLRKVRTATQNDWSALAWSRDRGFAHATARPNLEIQDRLGGGDSFASGLFYGLMVHDDLQLAVELGAANGALAMTTPGDITTARLAEIEALAQGGSARVQR